MESNEQGWPPSAVNGQPVAEALQQAAKDASALIGLWGPVGEPTVPSIQVVQALALVNIANQLARLADAAERAAKQS